MPILDLQKRARELGRIRLGVKETFTKRNGEQGTRPAKLDRFRLTSPSRDLLEKVAELYGGDVAEWTPPGGTQQWEVITSSARLPIMVPPQPVTQWFEFWTRAGCQHRCDGRTNVLTDEPCDPEDERHIEALKKPTTRLNVVLRDVQGIGVWRVETHGWNAAIELPDVAEFLAQAGGYVNGWLALEQRTSIEQTDRGPQTRHFAVPIIEVDVTPAQLMAGGGRVAAPVLDGPVPQDRALEAGQAAADGDPFAPFVEQVAATTKLDDLAGVWDAVRMSGLPKDTPEAAAFIEAWKARAHALKAAEDQAPPQSAAAAAEPDEEGAYPAEIVEDDGDADAVWQQIVRVGGDKGFGLSALTADFAEQMGGLDPGTASAAELKRYLGLLEQGSAA